MSTLDSAAVWSATSLAFDEKKIGAAGLSVRQRKLLTLLSQPASLSQLAQSIALPVEDVQAALERFAKLGFVQSSDEVPLDPMQTQLRSHSVAESPSRMPLLIGIAVAVLAAVSAAAWLLRGSIPSTTSAPIATSAAKAQAPTATGPSDTADNGLPGPVTKSAVSAPTVPVAAPAAAANTAVATPGRPALTPPVADAVVAPPTKVAATLTVAPTATSTAAAPAAAAPVTPALTLATALPAAPATQPAAAPAAVAPATVTPAAQVATAAATSAPAAATVATPAARPTVAAREIKLVNRVEPTFPRGYDADKGTVRARLQVDARGAVTGVDIVEANPPRVFDRTVRTALQQWRYEPTGEAFSVIAEINFNR